MLFILHLIPIQSTQGKLSKTQRILSHEQRNHLKKLKLDFSEHLLKVYYMPSTVPSVVDQRWMWREAYIHSVLAPEQPTEKKERAKNNRKRMKE